MTNKEKKSARMAGVLFLAALVASILGGTMIDAALGAPDFFQHVPANTTQIILGVLLELVNCIAVVGIAVLLFPILKKQDEAMALGYVAFRIVESVVLITAVVSPLAIIGMSQVYGQADAGQAANLQTIGISIMGMRGQIVGILAAIFFSLTALVLYTLLYQSKLVPRFISVWGFIGVALMLSWNFLELFGYEVSIGIALALPLILNELFLALWLIIKGVNSAERNPEPALVI